MAAPDVSYVHPYQITVQICQCPHCRAVWTHVEAGSDLQAARRAMQRYGPGPVQCSECGGWSRIPDRGLWQRFWRGYRREPCPPPDAREVAADDRDR